MDIDCLFKSQCSYNLIYNHCALPYFIFLCPSQAGRSRSATIITGYLMKNYQLSFLEAYHRLMVVKQDVG